VTKDFREILNLIANVTSERRGIRPRYTSYHVVKALNTLIFHQPIGRIKLSEEIGLGEASIRTMIRRFREMNIIEVDPVAGITLTDKGVKLWSTWINNVIVCKISIDYIIGNVPHACIIVKNGENIARKLGIIKIRDMIVRRGAEGALIILVDDKGAYIPSPTGEKHYDHKLTEDIRKCLCKYGDLILISWSISKRNAEKALIEALIDILREYFQC